MLFSAGTTRAIYTLSLHDALPILQALSDDELRARTAQFRQDLANGVDIDDLLVPAFAVVREGARRVLGLRPFDVQLIGDRKSTRLNSSHVKISYAVFCLKKKKKS